MFSSRESEKKKRKGFFARRFGASTGEKSDKETLAEMQAAKAGPILDPVIAAPETAAENSISSSSETPDDSFFAEEGDFTESAPSVEDPLDGLPLDAYCAANDLTTADVWRRLRSGELTGRTEKGRLLIYQHGSLTADGPLHLEPAVSRPSAEVLSALPPVPENNEIETVHKSGGYLALTGQPSGSPELAMLLDHLSIAKEENREILRMTQESIKKVTQLSDSLVEMKDQVIEAKEVQIRMMRDQLELQGAALSKLKQLNEDLEMLARTLTKDV